MGKPNIYISNGTIIFMQKCFHCKIIKEWKSRKKRFIIRRPIPCSVCHEIGWYTPPEYTLKLDGTIKCSKCMPQPIIGTFLIYGNSKDI